MSVAELRARTTTIQNFTTLALISAQLLVPTLLAISACAAPDTQRATHTETRDTSSDAWLHDRARQEQHMAATSGVTHDFRFTNALGSSGIMFRQRIVDDAGRAYKPVHYDHGTGVCAA